MLQFKLFCRIASQFMIADSRHNGSRRYNE